MKPFEMKRFIFLCATFSALSMMAGVSADASDLQKLSEIRNDRNPSVSLLSAELAANQQLQGFHFDTQHVGDELNGQETHFSFSLAQVQTARGVVLDGAKGRDAVLLHGTVDLTAGLGNLVVTYLANGLTGNYKDCPVKLVRNGSGTWLLMNAHSGLEVTEIFVKTWMLGISDLQGICE